MSRVHESALAIASLGTEVNIPVSPEGEEIRRCVRQPRQQQEPVGYKQSFLEHYTPNGTAYLPHPYARNCTISAAQP